jgi:hypothetical protein
MKMRHVSSGVCQVFSVNIEHEIYKRVGVTLDNKFGESWVQFGGELMMIAVGHGPVLWGVDYGHDVWYKKLG